MDVYIRTKKQPRRRSAGESADGRKNGGADPLSETPAKTTPGGPPEQIFVQSYTGDHGRPSDDHAGGRPTAPGGGKSRRQF